MRVGTARRLRDAIGAGHGCCLHDDVAVFPSLEAVLCVGEINDRQEGGRDKENSPKHVFACQLNLSAFVGL